MYKINCACMGTVTTVPDQSIHIYVSKLKNICNVNVARIARKRKARKSEET